MHEERGIDVVGLVREFKGGQLFFDLASVHVAVEEIVELRIHVARSEVREGRLQAARSGVVAFAVAGTEEEDFAHFARGVSGRLRRVSSGDPTSAFEKNP